MVTIKNVIFCYVTPCGSSQHASVATSPLILATLMMDALRSSETSDLTRATCRNIPEDGILQHLYCLK
jgi:hypothetical protein